MAGKAAGSKGRKIGRQKRNACDLGQRARTTANKLARSARDAAKKPARTAWLSARGRSRHGRV